MDLRNLILRAAFGCILAVLSVAVARCRLPRAISELKNGRFDLYFLSFFSLGHIFIFVTVFLVLHQKIHGDLPGVYVPQAQAVMKGLAPYRDFESSYAPLNPYFDAFLLRLHNSGLTILVFQILCEIASIPFWIGFLRRAFPEGLVRKAALLYLVQPLTLWETCIDGKNQACIALFLGIALYAIARREVLSGLSFGTSIVLVKILPLMFLPALFLGARKRGAWLIGALALPALVYAGFWLNGIDVAHPVRVLGSVITSNDLPYFVSVLSGVAVPVKVVNLVNLLGTGTMVAWTTPAQIRARGDEVLSLRRVSFSMLAVMLTVLALSGKSQPDYLGIAFFLLCILVAVEAESKRSWTAYVYGALSAVVLPIMSIWYWPLNEATGAQLRAMCLQGNKGAWVLAVGLAVLLFSYSWFVVRALGRVNEDLPGAQSNPLAA